MTQARLSTFARARAAARAAMHIPERVWHPIFRRAARRRLAEHGIAERVVFICYGNICRSPFAVEVFKRSIVALARRDASVRSAGFIGPNREPPEAAQRVALRRGYDVSAHRSSLIEPWVLSAELIVVMDPAQAVELRNRFGRPHGVLLVLGDLDPRGAQQRTIRDPWGCEDAIFDQSFARIERCVDAMVHAMIGSDPADRD